MRYYAENLCNLGAVSLSIESPNYHSGSVKFTSSTELKLGNTSSLIVLPCACETVPLEVVRETSRFRLKSNFQVEETKSQPKAFHIFPKFEPPSCACGSPLVPDPVSWKPMPSDHWAELMDVWHCHKPSNDSETSKGMYGLVMNGIHPRPGLALYSDTYYLISPQDLQNHQTTCILMQQSMEGSELKVWRWDLGERFQSVIIRMLREKIDAHAVWTFLVNEELTLWVVQADSQFTLTGSQHSEGGMKVYFGDSHLSEQKSWEPLHLPATAFSKLRQQLTKSNSLLPKQLQKFGKWELGFIY